MYNLLTEPIIRVRTELGEEEASLPETMAWLAQGKIRTFSALRAHQEHGWHTFLTQLAAAALHRQGLSALPEDPETWAWAIGELSAPHEETAWHLLGEKWNEPAFMQPPMEESEKTEYLNESTVKPTPDALDMLLVASKNHELKKQAMLDNRPDDWMMALVSYQTMTGFNGARNYGISRMNQGAGNRSGFSLAPEEPGPGPRFRRDVRSLLGGGRSLILDRYPHYRKSGGLVILWTAGWDGKAGSGLDPGELDPLYIDMARRVRLDTRPGGRTIARRAGSLSPRIIMDGRNGVTGDPWAMVNRKDPEKPKVLSVAPIGFKHHLVAQYLAGEEWEQPALLIPTEEEMLDPAPMRLMARTVVRTQGKTLGIHRLDEPVGASLKAALGGDEDLVQELRKIVRERLDAERDVRGAFRRGILTLIGAGNHRQAGQGHDRTLETWGEALDRETGKTFLQDLQSELDAPTEGKDAVRRNWIAGDKGLVPRARGLLEQILDAMPGAGGMIYSSRAKAMQEFDSTVYNRKSLRPFLLERRETDPPEGETEPETGSTEQEQEG